jgi:hypothetical protein
MHLLIALLALAAQATLQTSASASGFSMAAPDGWHALSKQGVLDNMGKFKFTPAELESLLANHSGPIVAYQKYRSDAHAGLIPTIQVNLRRNPTKTFDEFVSSIARSIEAPKAVLPGFALIQAPHVVEVGGRRAVVFTSTYDLVTKRAETMKVRARTYAVPVGATFFQVNFIDGPDDDCAALFDQLVGTIRFD